MKIIHTSGEIFNRFYRFLLLFKLPSHPVTRDRRKLARLMKNSESDYKPAADVDHLVKICEKEFILKVLIIFPKITYIPF